MWTLSGLTLAAGLLWGRVFVGPLLLPDYPAALQSVGRYLAFGLIALPLAWLDRVEAAPARTRRLGQALKLSAIGNLLYYLCLAGAIQRASGPLPTMIIGTLPVVIAIVANRRNQLRDGRLPLAQARASLLAIGLGIACVNQVELRALRESATWTWAATWPCCWLIGVACWTWYPLQRHWLRHHPDRPARAWSHGAEGLTTLPLACWAMARCGSPAWPAGWTWPCRWAP